MLHQLTDGCGLGHDEGQERRAFHHDGDVLADIAAAFTDFQLERAAFYIPPAAFGLPVCKGALVQREGDCCGLAGLQKNLLKSLQLPDGKTAKSILVSCGARLAVFDIQELREITAYDELHLDTLGDKRTALFLIMSDTDASFNFLISLAYSQMFNLLCEKADDVYGGRLPVHVRCLLDEFANIGQIPNFERLIATIRSREISACIVLQAQSQLKAIYKDSADTIVGNCDTLLFLGGKEKTTLKEMEELLGKETIDTFNTGESRGREVSHSLNYQKLGKSLMTMDELAVMDGGKCILQLRGVRPFLSEKYDITKHPNYKYLSDFHPKNAFHIEKYLSHQLKLRLEEEFAAIEVEVSGTSEEEEALLDEWAEEVQQQAAEAGGLF